MFSFGKKLTPTEQVRKWKRELNKEIRGLERSIRSITMEEQKTKAEIKKLAKRGDTASIKVLAKELIQSKKAKEKMYEGKSRLISVIMQLQANLATIKVAGCIEKSNGVLKSMNDAVKLPELMHVMRDMAQEMEKAGLIDEMIEDSLDMLDDEDIETETDAQVNQIITELTTGVLSDAKAAPTTPLPVQEQVQETEEVKEHELDEMKKRLQAL